ncbi:MAG: Flp family type IVb pilin [Planctomycetaceae bacterium]|nr:Flp family type IVb pilin [Planctomycetaceae bacterium]
MNRWKQFLREDDGPAVVEYGILLAMIVLGSVSTLGGFGVGMHNIYVIISGALP